MTYTLLPNGMIQRDEDKAIIPPTVENRDYLEFQAWVAAGNTPSRQPVLISTDNTFGEDPWLS